MIQQFGWQKDKYDKRDYLLKRRITPIPDKFSLSQYLTEIRDQGNVGSCVGHGIGINLNSVKMALDIFDEWCSPTFIYNGARFLEGTLPLDIGCQPRDALDWTSEYGILLEHFWPYDPTKLDQSAPSTERIKKATRYKGFQYFRCVDDIDGLCDAISSRHFVSIGTPWFKEWVASPPDGMLPKPTNSSIVAGGHETCFTIDTKIAMLDGRDRTIGELFAEYGEEKSFWVYSCDGKGNIVPGKASHIRKTGENKPLIKITLDNGEIIKCTENHPFLLHNGKYKLAKDLVINESLMPLYREIDECKLKGYEIIYNPGTNRWRYTHRLIAERCLGKSKGNVTHHKNFIKRDNRPDNLTYKTWDKHTILHKENVLCLNNYARSDEGKQKSKELMVKLWRENHDEMYARIVNNGFKYRARAAQEGRLGFQTVDKELLKKHARNNGLKARGCKRTIEAKQRISEGAKQSWARNYEVRILTAFTNLAAAHKKNKLEVTERQRKARRLNALKLCGQRWNHKVVQIKQTANEDVYDFTVEEYHNFALASGVFVHNCLYGYDRIQGIFYGTNSWGTGWGDHGRYIMPFEAIEVFKNRGGYDAHYIMFTSVVDDSPIPTPTPSPCPWGKGIANFLNAMLALRGRKGRFYYRNL